MTKAIMFMGSAPSRRAERAGGAVGGKEAMRATLEWRGAA